MAALAREKGVRTMVGIQARSSPIYLRLKELIDEGYVGDLLAAKVSWMATELTSPAFKVESDKAWRSQREGGANALTIAFGHVIDPFCAAVGEFTELAAIAATQVKTWNVTDTGDTIEATAPDNILVSGRTTSGTPSSRRRSRGCPGTTTVATTGPRSTAPGAACASRPLRRA